MQNRSTSAAINAAFAIERAQRSTIFRIGTSWPPCRTAARREPHCSPVSPCRRRSGRREARYYEIAKLPDVSGDPVGEIRECLGPGVRLSQEEVGPLDPDLGFALVSHEPRAQLLCT